MSPVVLNESPTASVRAPAVAGGAARFTVTTNDVPIVRPGAFGVLRVSMASFVTYGLMVATLIGAKLYFLNHPTDFPLEAQASAFEWRVLLTLASCGLFGLVIAPYARFPDMWDGAVPRRKRLLGPLARGAVYGLVTIVRGRPRPAGDRRV